jgi:hypothetical protein
MSLQPVRSDIGWATSSCEMEDKHKNDYTYEWNNHDDGVGVENDDEESSSPFAQLERKLIDEAWNEDGRRDPSRLGEDVEETAVDTFEYLPKHQTLDTIEGKTVLSGWIAASFGSDSLQDRLRQGAPVVRDDIFYMRIVEQNGQASIFLQKHDDRVEHTMLLQRDWVCSSLEISSRVGRCVVLRSSAGDVVTLLPVSLDESFFPLGELVPAKKFIRIHDRLFVSGKGKVYAPDAQHDAATYILFSLDALIKSCWN